MTPEHRLAIEIMSECGKSRAAIVKDSGWYLDDAPSMSAVRAVLRKRRNKAHLLTINGKTMTVNEWAKETGIGRKTLHERIRVGWTDEEVLTTPVRFTSQEFRTRKTA